MKIWLDDEREMPEGFDVHVHDLDELKELLSERDDVIELMSFDNDLGEEKKEGWEIMQWLGREYPERYPNETRVHSANGPAAERMEGYDANFRKHVMGEGTDEGAGEGEKEGTGKKNRRR